MEMSGLPKNIGHGYRKKNVIRLFVIALILTGCASGGGGGSSPVSPVFTYVAPPSDIGNGDVSPSTPTLVSTSTPTLTSANYSSDWTTTGTVVAPSVSSKTETYSDGSSIVLENGSSSNPFNQTTLSALSISDSNSFVLSPTATYNLTWGTPDKNGPAYAALHPNPLNHLSNNLSYMGVTVAGQGGVTGPTLVQPHADVLAAWNAGWTGKGTNILMIDDYASVGSCVGATSCHGITTMMITDLIAPGANKFGLNRTLSSLAKTSANAELTVPTNINVINMSYGANSTAATSALNILTGATSISNLILTSAVITKSAGNDAGKDSYSHTSQYIALNQQLIDNAGTVNRTLIVGALNGNGSVASPVSIASYSNVAGSNATMQSRFVVANGNTPYAAGGVSMNGYNVTGYNSLFPNYGTSYSAPVVAGYAAIIMQKFPNLDAAKTTNIILDTARKDTISGYDVSIHGQGEASLSRALSPVGRLR
jgi:hypothetical protein